MVNRNLDYRYFPMCRDGKLVHVCFTDLKTYERDRVLKGQSAEWLEWLCRDLANALQEVGDKLDLSREGSSILIGEHPEIQNLSAEEQRSERPRRRPNDLLYRGYSRFQVRSHSLLQAYASDQG